MNPATVFGLLLALLLPGCAILPPCYSLAKDVSGQVREASTGRPIANATLRVWEADMEPFHTTATGTFSTGPLRRFWSPVPHPFLTVRASARGYRSTDLQVPLPLEGPSGNVKTETHHHLLIVLEPK